MQVLPRRTAAPARTSLAARLAGLAAGAAFLATVLGLAVARRPPNALDAGVARALFGHGAPVAWAITQTGYTPAISAILVVVFALAWRARAIPAALVLLVSQSLSQGVVELLKRAFDRPRPIDWLYHHELNMSFPSGHSVTAIVLFGGLLAYVLAASGLRGPVRSAVAGALAFWILALGWSRLALGAHFLTDVLGGYLYGIAWLALTAIAYRAVAARYAMR